MGGALPPPPTFATTPLATRTNAAPGYGEDGMPLEHYAGFWRRFWARIVTSTVVSIVFTAGMAGILAATRWTYDTLSTCDIDSSGRQYCTREPLILLGGLIISWIFGVIVTHYLYTRRLVNKGYTTGMSQMGLVIRSTSHSPTVTKSQAFRRNLLALLPAWLGSACLWIPLYLPSNKAVAIALVAEGALIVLAVLGSLWNLLNERRQTVWDIVGDTVVMADREPSWIALSAFVVGCLVPYGIGVTTWLIGVQALRNNYDDASSGEWSVLKIVAALSPLAAVTLGAIILGHLGVRATSWETRRLAGRGLARTGMVLGYSVPALVVLSIVFSVIYTRFEENKRRSCTEVRKELVIAAESFRTLNGEYPASIGQISGSPYVIEEGLTDQWDLRPQPGSYRIVGKDKCAKA